MTETLRSIAKYALGGVALILLAWIVFKIVLGIVATLVWVAVAVLLLLALVWLLVRVL